MATDSDATVDRAARLAAPYLSAKDKRRRTVGSWPESTQPAATAWGWTATSRYAAGVPCGPTGSIDRVAADPHAAARQVIAETDHPYFGTVRQFTSPVRMGAPRREHVRAPSRIEHAVEILSDLLGHDADRIAECTSQGAFSPA